MAVEQTRGGGARKRKKKGELKPDTQELGPLASHFFGLKTCQPEGCGMVPIPAFINASRTRSLIYNRLTADILQVP